MNSHRTNIYLTGLTGSGKTSISNTLNNHENIQTLTMSDAMLETAKKVYNILDRKEF